MSDHKPHPASPDYFFLRIRRRPCASWMAWFLWLVALAILLEFSLASFAEREVQPGVVAGGMFVVLLMAGLIIEITKIIESHSVYRDVVHQDATEQDIVRASDADMDVMDVEE